MLTTPERDFEKEPLTELEKAYLTIAHFQFQYDRLKTAAERVIFSQRPLSKGQLAVLADRLDELMAVTNEPTPKWGPHV